MRFRRVEANPRAQSLFVGACKTIYLRVFRIVQEIIYHVYASSQEITCKSWVICGIIPVRVSSQYREWWDHIYWSGSNTDIHSASPGPLYLHTSWPPSLSAGEDEHWKWPKDKIRADEAPRQLSTFRNITLDDITLQFATFGSLIPIRIFSQPKASQEMQLICPLSNHHSRALGFKSDTQVSRVI